MLEILLQSSFALLRHWLVLPRPPIAAPSFDNVQSLLDLFCMPYCGIRNAVNAVIFFANGGDDLVPQETIKSQEERYRIEW
jgi:hypothetical protein